MKAGGKTTEFYFNAGIALVGLLASTGLISPTLSDTLTDVSPDLQAVINQILDLGIRGVGLITSLFAGKNYTASRVAIKRIGAIKK